MSTTEQVIVRDWMKHLGYEPDEIAAAEAQDHAPECEFTGEYWMCHDENNRSHHPARDEMDDVVALVMFALAHPAIAAPRVWAMPPEPDADVIRVRDVYGQCFTRADAIDENGSIPVWLGDAFTDEADVPDLYLSWQQLMKEHGPLTEVVSDVA